MMMVKCVAYYMQIWGLMLIGFKFVFQLLYVVIWVVSRCDINLDDYLMSKVIMNNYIFFLLEDKRF